MIEGMGKDAETIYNEQGAGQSKLNYRFDLFDARSMFAMAKVLSEGAEKYGADNWRGIPTKDHLNHLIAHAYAFLSGDTQDEHLSHVMCRAMFALGVELDPQEPENINTKKITYPHYDIPTERLWLSQTEYVTHDEIYRQCSPHRKGEEWKNTNSKQIGTVRYNKDTYIAASKKDFDEIKHKIHREADLNYLGSEGDSANPRIEFGDFRIEFTKNGWKNI